MRAYGIYQNIRDSAWQCLINYKITSIPVDVLQITRVAGFHVIKNSSINVLLPGEHGRSYFDGSNWHIIYNDLDPTEVSRYTVAHELGHIFLNHELKLIEYSHLRAINPKPISEEQADRFARRLLCPACVLWGLDLHTTEEIAEHCRVDTSVATERAKRMKTLYKRGKFLTSPLEKALYDQFKEYIQNNK